MTQKKPEPEPEPEPDFMAVAKPGTVGIAGQKAEVAGMNIKIVPPRGRPPKPSGQQLERQRAVVDYYHVHGLEATLAHFPEINSARTVLEYERRVDKAPQR